jgi:hypothetical protein
VPPEDEESLWTSRLKLLLELLLADPLVLLLPETLTVVWLPSLFVTVFWVLPFLGTGTSWPFTSRFVSGGLPLVLLVEKLVMVGDVLLESPWWGVAAELPEPPFGVWILEFWAFGPDPWLTAPPFTRATTPTRTSAPATA